MGSSIMGIIIIIIILLGVLLVEGFMVIMGYHFLPGQIITFGSKI